MASVNQTRPHCVNQMGKTHSKPLAARHGRGTAWARHVMCELVFMLSHKASAQLYIHSYGKTGDRVGTVVKVLCYKSEGRWFDSR